MSLRFRRSKQIAPGVRLNVGSKSIGLSAGRRGLHIGYNSLTGAYVSAGLTGTGLYFRQNLGKLHLAEPTSTTPPGASTFTAPSAPQNPYPANTDETAIIQAAQEAEEAIQKHRPQAAIAPLEFLRKATPNNIDVLFHLSAVLVDTDPGRGRDLMLEFLRRSGGADSRADKGFGILGCHFCKLGDFSNAERAFIKAQELSTSQDERDELSFLTAFAVFKAGDIRRTLRLLCNLKPRLPDQGTLAAQIHLLRGACFHKIGKEKAAQSEWQKAQDIIPGAANDINEWLD